MTGERKRSVLYDSTYIEISQGDEGGSTCQNVSSIPKLREQGLETSHHCLLGRIGLHQLNSFMAVKWIPDYMPVNLYWLIGYIEKN